MGEHKFTEKSDNGFWMVSCVSTGGSFSTGLWANDKVPMQQCPCCKDIIPKRKSKGRVNTK
jgi:hypothetical protein